MWSIDFFFQLVILVMVMLWRCNVCSCFGIQCFFCGRGVACAFVSHFCNQYARTLSQCCVAVDPRRQSPETGAVRERDAGVLALTRRTLQLLALGTPSNQMRRDGGLYPVLELRSVNYETITRPEFGRSVKSDLEWSEKPKSEIFPSRILPLEVASILGSFSVWNLKFFESSKTCMRFDTKSGLAAGKCDSANVFKIFNSAPST